MRKCIATVSISGTLPEKLDAIAAARFDAVEVFENDLISFLGTPRDLQRMAADHGLGIDLYQPFRDFDAGSDAQFRRNLDRAEHKFDLMQALGAPMLLVCSNVSATACGDDARVAAQLYELAERSGRRGLRIGYEALAWGRHVRHYRHAWAIVEKADHPHLGVVVDSFHILSLGDDPAGIADIPGEKIFFLQMADAPRLAMDVLQWSRHYRCFPGQGQFDLARFLECVLRAGYTGPFSLEIFNDLFREAPNRRTAVDAMQSILYCEAETRKRLEQTAAGAAAPAGTRVVDRVELFDPPAPPPLEGVAFLEFAVDEASGPRLGTLLEAFGFHRAGRHRSKHVTLYRQGKIHLILNAEPGSFARARFDDHGPSVVAVGLATSDSVRGLNRATALHCPRFDGRVGRGEFTVPAVRAPDDTLIYFVPAELASGKLFEVDFDLVGPPTLHAGDAGLLYVDHVARGLPIEGLDTWILFHRALLGMEPGESLELSDPFGLVRSCGVASANRAVRVVLNVSQSRSTRMAKTIAAQGGATVHHIAFACADIFVTMGALRSNGAKFVPVAGNYHDDLAARFDLDPSLLARMREYGVLYERTGDGEYFHAYSESFADRFFFEIVQRVGRYDGYGAMNAPVRLASQAQRSEMSSL